jgi:hypothetical protein
VIAFMDSPQASNTQYPSQLVRGTRRQAHWIANGCHQRNIWQGELSKQNSAEAKSEGNKRAAGSKYNQSEISHEFPRDLSAEHYVLPHRTIICASGAYFFMSNMSFVISNMKTHVSY